MIYATSAQFVNAFSEREAVSLTNSDDPAAQYINDDALNRALADASAEIDSYLVGLYSLPLPEAPATLIVHCLNIARYRLSMVAPGEDVRKRYEDTLKFLEMISQGKISLGVDSGGSEIERSDLPMYKAAPRVWTRQTLRGW